MSFRILMVRIIMIGLLLAAIGLFLYSPPFFDALYRKKSISILAWPTELDAEYLASFEQKTGIKVYVNYLESNEELLAKIRLHDAHGYDLVMVSDYMVEQMRTRDLLKPIDKQRFVHWDQLYPELLGHYFDPVNRYSIPYFWDVYGLAIDTKSIPLDTAKEVGWGLLFNPREVRGSIGMTEDRREIILMAAFYLYNTIDGIDTSKRIDEIVRLLRMQKKWVEMYTDTRSSALIASGACPVTVSLSTDVIRVRQQHAAIAFVLPNAGSFMIIDSFAIPRQSTKEEFIYQFLNHLYDSKQLQHYADKHMLRTAHCHVRAASIVDTMIPNKELFSRLSFFRNVFGEKRLNQLWISVVS
jgi:spermidine/putrescine transport system substrate-binding protein